jgi:hypothetical protein
MEGSPPTLRGKISDFGLSCKFPSILTLKFSPINRNGTKANDHLSSLNWDAGNSNASESSSKVSTNDGTGSYHTSGNSDSSSSSSNVSINGGTFCYQAPELFKKYAKFSRSADVFAAGVVFLELLTLQKPNSLWIDLYPGILEVKLPVALLKCISSSLDPDPEKRMHFTELLVLLRSQDGIEIGGFELGSPADKYTFDEVAADIRIMMPSSQYDYESSSSRGAFSGSPAERMKKKKGKN